MKKHFLCILAAVLSHGLADIPSAYAAGESESISEADFLGAKLAGEEIGIWFRELPKRPASVAIFNTSVQPPLVDAFAPVVETEVYNNLRNIPDLRVSACPDCRNPRVQVLNDRLIVSKGSPNIEIMKELGRQVQVESFLILDVHRTAVSIVVQANLYHAGSGDVIQSSSFRLPVLAIAGTASIVMLTLGPGMAFEKSDKESSTPPLALGISLLEELGFGKGGLHIGAVAAKSGVLAYVQPTLSWRGRFSSASVSSLKGVGLGLGMSSQSFGISPRLFYQFFIGTFTSIGLEATYLVPLKKAKNENESVDGYVGVNIGFSLGR